MAKVTRIKAKDTPEKATAKKKVPAKERVPEKAKKGASAVKASADTRASRGEKPKKKPFILWRPLVYLGRYIRDSWREIRQVRWPNRKTTWKMVLAVVIYTAIFMIFISLLDLLFSKLAGLVFGNG